VGHKYDDAGEFRTGMVNMHLPDLIKPTPPMVENPPAADFAVQFKIWKLEW
jgi:hypothetical protein